MSRKQPSSSRSAAGRSRFVELIRLAFITALATIGFAAAQRVGNGVPESQQTLLGVGLGAATGYVIGGVVGRFSATAVESFEIKFRRRTAAETVMGVAGLIAGLVIAALISLPLLLVLPATAAWFVALIVYLVFGSAGWHIGHSRNEEIFALIGLKPRAAGTSRTDVSVIDTSVLIDGRVVDLADTGFATGTMLIHSGVLGELQMIADSSDPGRRSRGRRGLDALATLQKNPRLEVVLVEEEGAGDVDAALVRLARERGGTLITADVNLAKVAGAVGVPVQSINALAAAFRTPLTPGEELALKLVKEGREHGQGVGYLEDGTMVVVQDAATEIGNDVTVRVTNLLQTSTGRMVFATIAEEAS